MKKTKMPVQTRVAVQRFRRILDNEGRGGKIKRIARNKEWYVSRDGESGIFVKDLEGFLRDENVLKPFEVLAD